MSAKSLGTDDVAIDSLQDPVHARIFANFLPDSIVRANEVALRRKADANELLRRSRVTTPEPTVFAIKLMEILPRFCRPCTYAAFSATYLDDAFACGVERNLPVKAITPEIDQCATLVAISLERVEHLLGVIFGMAASEYSLVGL